MAVDLRVLTNTDRGFYALLGPVLSRRDIERELGARVHDDDGKVWFVAVDGRELLGFCAALGTPRSVRLVSDYVLPAHRGRGVYRQLFAARLAHYPDRPMTATCTAAGLHTYRANGFYEVRARGAYVDVARG